MGLCASSEAGLTDAEREARKAEIARSKQLDKENIKAQFQDQAINKLLLLGAGESGKSTLFKQMMTIYGKGYSKEERESFKAIVHNNVISAMKILVSQLDRYNEKVDKTARQTIEEVKVDADVDAKLAAIISSLWKSQQIQRVFEKRSDYQLPDSADYFFDRVNEISQPNYIPNEQDILRSRVRTTGIVENRFEIEGNEFKMFDVGGQRNERKKWMHCFENVTAVLFVAALSEYDQKLFEDESTNRLDEAITLFYEICNSKWFRKTSMILFLNKRDLFETKLQKKPLSDYDFVNPLDPDNSPEERIRYFGDNSFQHASAWMTSVFQDLNREKETKTVYAHVTCATDTSNVAAVFDAVKDIIIQKSLDEAGLR